MLSKPSVIALILANLVPIAGVLVLDWHVFDVVILYWAENVVIGVVNVLRMIVSKGASARYFDIPFFIVHYGMFCFGHYTGIVAIFGGGPEKGLLQSPFLSIPLSEAWQSPLWIGVAGIAISHLLSFRTNFIGGGEYLRTNTSQLMRRPYGRIVVLHIGIIAGGFLVSLLGDPVWALIVLIVIKTGIDLRMHTSERRIFAVE
jgi:hypothetical protein